METVLDQVCTSCGSARLAYGRYCLFCGDLLSEPTAKVVVSSEAANPLDKAGNRLAGGNRVRRFLAARLGGNHRCGAGSRWRARGYLLVIDFAAGRVGGMLGYERWISKVAAGMAYILVLTIGAWLYCAFSESSPRRATIGKRIMGLQVVTADGGRVSFGQATVRHFMKFLSLFSAGVGFMMAGWTKRHQALHDMPCDCIVIRVSAGKGFLAAISLKSANVLRAALWLTQNRALA